MKLYLAGPMRGHPDLNFPAFFEAAAWLREQGHEVFNPAEPGPDVPIREAMAADLAWICTDAEAIAFLPGSFTSKGAQAEIATADAIGLPVAHYRSFHRNGGQLS